MSKEEDLVTAIVTELTTAPLTSAESRVYPMRYKYADLAELPMIAVYDASMTSQNMPEGNSEERMATIEIMLHAHGLQTPASRATAADTILHTLRAAVETKLGNAFDDLGVDGIADKIYQGYRIVPDAENKDSEYLVLTCAMRYDFKYFNELADL